MSQILDRDTLNTLRDVIGDDLEEIIQSFLALLPGQVSAIESASKVGDSAALRLHAHTLKGSASNSELNRLTDRTSNALRTYIA